MDVTVLWMTMRKCYEMETLKNLILFIKRSVLIYSKTSWQTCGANVKPVKSDFQDIYSVNGNLVILVLWMEVVVRDKE